MKEVMLSTWEEFEKEMSYVIDRIAKKRAAGGAYISDVLFRGQAKAEWKLDTTLERYTNTKYTVRDYHSTMRAIQPVVESFAGIKWDLSDETDEKRLVALAPVGYEFMIYLRHHGFPSPLLDWTRSPYIAAFFAFRSGLHAESGDVAIYSYIEHFGEGKGWSSGKATIYGLGPYVTTHRRHYNQQSEYTICCKKVDDAYAYCNHEEAFRREESEQDITTKYVIPRRERAKALDKLDLMNITAYSLFGHEESLMETLRYREIERRSVP